MLAQRLARHGWRIVILEAGPFWHPDQDWVSDEAGAHPLYWTQKRIIGGADPIELGKNNSGRGVGGSMVHYAGYTPRFHPSDFSTYTDDGVGADWPIGYQDLRPHYERVETRATRRRARTGPGGTRTATRSRHTRSPGQRPSCARARCAAVSRCASARSGSSTAPSATGRTASTAATACKVARSTPKPTRTSRTCPTRWPTASRSAPTAWPFAWRSTTPPVRALGVVYAPDDAEAGGERRMQRARCVAVAGYSIETPRLLLASTSRRHPHGLGNNADLLGRYVMVQGASQSAGRWPEELRMYKAPPPEISSEQFYETDPSRGFARGFSIQTVSPLPIGWAEHVLADGHWGRALREYMRDYNHWATIGVLNELLPYPDNRVTLADETDDYGQPIARMDYTLSENDKTSMAYSTQVITGILRAAEAQDVLSIQRFAHLIGGARMGTSPETGVVNADHRVWEVPNLFIADGSVCPTQGSANPALTIMALSSRLAQRMARGAVMEDNLAAGSRP